MTFKFHCACGQKVSATKEMIGTSATCPQCGKRVVVPQPPESAPSPPPIDPPPKVEEKAPLSLPALPPEPAAPPKEPAVAIPSEPVRIVRRPVGMLWATATATSIIATGAGAWLLRGHIPHEPRLLAIIGGAAVIAVVLPAIVLCSIARIVIGFALGFVEALPLTLVAGVLYFLALTPAALARLGAMPPEAAARMLPITLGASLLLTLVAYATLIRDARGRPIGLGRGFITCLVQVAFVQLLAAALVTAARRLFFHA